MEAPPRPSALAGRGAAGPSGVGLRQQMPEPKVERLRGAAAVQALPLRVRRAAAYVGGGGGGGGGDDASTGTGTGTWTQVLVHDYADAMLVVVSQVGKVGCLTQVTMQRRPSHFAAARSALLDADLDDNDDGDNSTGASAARAAAAPAGPRPPLGFEETSALLGTCTQQRLLGSHPPGQRALYDLYNANVAARAAAAAAAGRSGDDSGSLQDKPVIVGLALAMPARAQARTRTQSPADDDDDDDFDVLADEERTRFEGVLALVSQACTPA